MKKIALTMAAICALTLSTGQYTFAHHSTAAYDFNQNLELVGTVKSFRWANPHNYVLINVVNDQGVSEEWSIEAGTPATAIRHGFSRNTFKPGEKVTVVVAPMRDGSRDGTLKTVQLSDGTVLKSVAADANATKPFEALPSLERATPKE